MASLDNMFLPRLRSFGLVLLVTLSAGLPAVRAADTPDPAAGLREGDLVGICGDSITEQKLYSLDMAAYLVMCQPKPKLQAVQFGWSGEKAPEFAARLANDILPFHPTVVTTCYGMNDGGYAATTQERLDTYRTNLTAAVESFKKAGVHFIVVGSPGAVDTFYYNRAGGTKVYNQTLADLAKVASEVASKEGATFADVHAAMMTAMAKAKAANGEKFCVAGNDGVHPTPAGHLIMAYAFLKALGCDGEIATITVDLKSNQATADGGTTVTSFAAGKLALESTRYPFCFPDGPDKDKDPSATRSMLPFLPFNQDLNRYLLVVKNAPGKMTVTWGKESKTFTAEQLTQGVNLAAEFLDNPFKDAFTNVVQKLAAQQAFETLASKQLLHSFLNWQKVPDSASILNPVIPQLTDKLLAQWKTLATDSTSAVVPVKHEITIAPAAH